MIIGPLGPGHDVAADEVEVNAFRDRRDYYTLIEVAIINTIEPQIRSWFYNTDSDAMIGDLKNHFEPQVRLMVYDCLNEFHSLKMEEHTSVGIHLAKMHGIHRRLILEFDHEISDPLANGAVLRSLPPSYRRFLEGFVMGGESFTFHDLMARVRTLKVEPVQGKIIDLVGIFDIVL
jgi:hypothetical protein